MTKLERVKAIRSEYMVSLLANQAGEQSDSEHEIVGTDCLTKLQSMGTCCRRAAWEILLPTDDSAERFALSHILAS